MAVKRMIPAVPVVPVAVVVGGTPFTSVVRVPQDRAAQAVAGRDRTPAAVAVAEPVAARAGSVRVVAPALLGLVGLVVLLEPTTTQTEQQAVTVSGLGPVAVEAVVPETVQRLMAVRQLVAAGEVDGIPAEPPAFPEHSLPVAAVVAHSRKVARAAAAAAELSSSDGRYDMAHFAELDENNIVLRVVVVANADLIGESGDEEEAVGQEYLTALLGGTWVQTSYRGSIRGRFAGPGSTYDSDTDEFRSPQPFPSWTWQPTIPNVQTAGWSPPVPYPVDGGTYEWDEENQAWNLA
jgi:hypothetical protein